MRWDVDLHSRLPLRDQIADCVRRGVAAGDLRVGDPLPPAAELAEALDVDRNTVLAAYRGLRTEGVLEFRRGRGVRVVRAPEREQAVVDAAAMLVDAGRAHGVGRDGLIQLIREMT